MSEPATHSKMRSILSFLTFSLLSGAVLSHEVRHIPSVSEVSARLEEVSTLLAEASPAALERLGQLSAHLGTGVPALPAELLRGVNGAVMALRTGDAAEASRLVTQLLADTTATESGSKHSYQTGYNDGYRRGHHDGKHGHYNNHMHTGNPQYDHGWHDGYDAGYNDAQHGQ